MLAIYMGVNVGMILNHTWDGGFDRDWELWRSLPIGGDLYADLGSELPYVWSPFMAPVMAWAVANPGIWAALHFIAPLMVRDVWFAGLLLVSWGFWTDVAGGNTFTFAVVAGVLAWRGSRSAAIVYVALLLLTPRPVQIPLAILLVYRMPEIRMGVGILVAANAAAVGAYMPGWASNMLDYASLAPHDFGPRVLIGTAWIPIGITAAALLTWRQRPGWAGLLVSAYWLPQYFLMPLVELQRPEQQSRAHDSVFRS